jgi:hypothetical protein
MRTLSTNSDLYQYLLQLAGDLRKLGSTDLADIVTTASNQASGMTTEFLGESRIALRQVRRRGRSILSEQACADLVDVLKQLDAALDKR